MCDPAASQARRISAARKAREGTWFTARPDTVTLF